MRRPESGRRVAMDLRYDWHLDPLRETVRLLRPRSVFAKRVRGGGHWGVASYPEDRRPSFCEVLHGRCWIRLIDAAPFQVERDDIVLLPSASSFEIASGPKVKARPFSRAQQFERLVHHGSDERDCEILGGVFDVDPAHSGLLLDLLPPMVHIRPGDPAANRIRSLIRLIDDESHAQRPGRELVLERLVEVMLIEALRHASTGASVTATATYQNAAGLLRGLADPGVGKALRALHANIAHPWTLAALASAAGMSRSVFAARFASTVGTPPMAYRNAWRIAVAKDLLREGQSSIEEVAIAVGYSSASAFSSSFSRAVGVSPSEYTDG